MIKKLIRFFGKRKITSAIILAFILGVMFYCSSIPGDSVSSGATYLSVLYHFGIFFLFSFFLLATVRSKKTETKDILIAFLISLAMSILDEFHQSFVPFRNAGVKDVLTDIIGSSVSIFLFYLFDKD